MRRRPQRQVASISATSVWLFALGCCLLQVCGVVGHGDHHASRQRNRRSVGTGTAAQGPGTTTTLELEHFVPNAGVGNTAVIRYRQSWRVPSSAAKATTDPGVPTARLERITVADWAPTDSSQHALCARTRAWPKASDPGPSDGRNITLVGGSAGVQGTFVLVEWSGLDPGPANSTLNSVEIAFICNVLQLPNCTTLPAWKGAVAQDMLPSVDGHGQEVEAQSSERVYSAPPPAIYYFPPPPPPEKEAPSVKPRYRRHAEPPTVNSLVAPKDIDLDQTLREVTVAAVRPCSTVLRWTPANGWQGRRDGLLELPRLFAASAKLQPVVDTAAKLGVDAQLKEPLDIPAAQTTPGPSIAVEVLQPQSLHPKAMLTVSASAGWRPHCAAAAEKPNGWTWRLVWYLPHDVFVDPYQIAGQLRDPAAWTGARARLARPRWQLYSGVTELEQHTGAVTAQAEVVVLEWPHSPHNSSGASGRKFEIEVPLHLRYRPPREGVSSIGHDTVLLIPPGLTVRCGRYNDVPSARASPLVDHSALAVAPEPPRLIVPVADLTDYIGVLVVTTLVAIIGAAAILIAALRSPISIFGEHKVKKE